MGCGLLSRAPTVICSRMLGLVGFLASARSALAYVSMRQHTSTYAALAQQSEENLCVNARRESEEEKQIQKKEARVCNRVKQRNCIGNKGRKLQNRYRNRNRYRCLNSKALNNSC
jgi:hypothetical protein